MKRWLPPVALCVLCAVLAWQATLSLMPRALMALAVRRVASAGGINKMTHAPIVTAKSRAIVRPSPDLLYSSCPFDVSAGPVLIDVAPLDAPYWSLSVFDSLTNVAFVGNNLDSGGAALRIALVKPGQGAPSGYRAVTPNGRRGVALIRILIDRHRPQAISAIDIQRRRSRCRVVN